MLTTKQVAEMLQALFNKRRICALVKCEDPSLPLYGANAIIVNIKTCTEYLYYENGQSYLTIHEKYDPNTYAPVEVKFHFQDPEFANKLIKRLRA